MVFRSIFQLLIFMPAFALAQETALNWQDLLPAGWEPEAVEINHDEFDPDNSIYEKTFSPIVDTLDGNLVSIAGYALPIVYDLKEVKEFLLVPYMGACLHMPAPPSNQVVHVKLQKPIGLASFAGPLETRGKISIVKSTNDFASSSYLLGDATALPYQAKK